MTLARSIGIEKPAAKGRLLGMEELREAIDAGLPYALLERLRGQLGASIEEIAEVLRISPRTLARRRREGRLSPEESDRLYRVAHVFAEAVDLLGDAAEAAAWLRQPNLALSGTTPLALLHNTIGVREVEALIGRVKFGVSL